jgi:FemAB-related protein (PEP-CTERM system-associated)
MHAAVQSVKCTEDRPEVDVAIQVRLHELADLRQNVQVFSAEIAQSRAGRMAHDPAWLLALQAGLGHIPFLLEAVKDGRAEGWLPLALVQSRLFGRFLVSLPYLNSAGVVAVDPAVGHALIDRALELADAHDVRYLELRHEQRWSHPALTQELTSKTHMRLALPSTADELWLQLDAKVRNQIRKAQKQELTVHWGGADRLNEFYDVFSRNMRDLGTPAFGRKLFQSVLRAFPNAAELCVVSAARRPIAAALLIHGSGTTEVPSASSLRRYNSTNANMLLYWHLLQRAIERGQSTFDFGRSSQDSNTYRFKKQWGAQPHPAVWQYYVRKGSINEMRPDNPRYQRRIQLWQRLPVWLTRLIGPTIVRGIP